MLRSSLDAAGLHHVQITAADGGPDVIAAAAKNESLAAAIGSFGIHAHVLAPVSEMARLWPSGVKPLFNTENDLVDGAMPQWAGTMQPSLNWPLSFINNFLLANGTATMLCPGFHGWSMNLGRHNHIITCTPIIHWLSMQAQPWAGMVQ